MDAIRWERRFGSLGGRGVYRAHPWGVAACVLAGLRAGSAHQPGVQPRPGAGRASAPASPRAGLRHVGVDEVELA